MHSPSNTTMDVLTEHEAFSIPFMGELSLIAGLIMIVVTSAMLARRRHAPIRLRPSLALKLRAAGSYGIAVIFLIRGFALPCYISVIIRGSLIFCARSSVDDFGEFSTDPPKFTLDRPPSPIVDSKFQSKLVRNIIIVLFVDNRSVGLWHGGELLLHVVWYAFLFFS
jgi:hypothetical protein